MQIIDASVTVAETFFIVDVGTVLAHDQRIEAEMQGCLHDPADIERILKVIQKQDSALRIEGLFDHGGNADVSSSLFSRDLVQDFFRDLQGVLKRKRNFSGIDQLQELSASQGFPDQIILKDQKTLFPVFLLMQLRQFLDGLVF